MGTQWKSNWHLTQNHFIQWWHHQGMVVTVYPCSLRRITPRESVFPQEERSLEEYFLNNRYRILKNHYHLAYAEFPFDNLPMTEVTFGPGSFGTYLGATPKISPQTIWYEPCYANVVDPTSIPFPTLDPQNPWYLLALDLLKQAKAQAQDNYLVGFPDLIENLDTLAALRGPEHLLTDLISYPEWVEQMVMHLNSLWFQVYETMYQIIREPDGSSAFQAFGLWGPGKVAKVQCDNGSMISPSMFKRFVLPALKEQCQWLDYSMFHVDGTGSLCHLDMLLELEELDAIEWTPEPKKPSGGSPEWYPLYKRILNAGKSVQIITVREHEIAPLLDAIGTQGVYLCVHSSIQTWDDVERIQRILEPYQSYT